MREVKSDQIKQRVKKSKTNLIIWLVVALCGAAIFALSLNMDKIRKGSDFHELLATGEKKENQYVTMEVTAEPYVFAYYPGDNSGKFYFLWDDQYIYVAFLNEKEFNRLNTEDIKENHLKVSGITKEIPSDIKKLALEAYNENVEKDQKLTSSQFNEYFGVLYLDQTESDPATVLCLIVGMIGWMAGFIGFLSQLIVVLKWKSNMKKISDEDWEAINKELDEEEAFYYKNAKLSLTNHYIVDFARGIKVFKYSDILWMYKYEYRYNGVNTQLSIILYTEDKKRHVIAALPGYTKKSKEVNREIMESIMDKNKKMLVGYTKENRQKMKEEYKIKA